jgi:hypothetical protein
MRLVVNHLFCNPLKLEVHLSSSINVLPTLQWAHYIGISMTNWLILFRDEFAVCSENQMQLMNTMWVRWRVNIKAAGTYNWYCNLKGVSRNSLPLEVLVTTVTFANFLVSPPLPSPFFHTIIGSAPCYKPQMTAINLLLSCPEMMTRDSSVGR